MNPLQRRSLFAILSLAESAIQQAKAILAHDPASEFKAAMGVDKPESNQPGTPDYLSEDEEEAFEKALEQDRVRMLDEENARMKALWGSDE